MLMPIEPQSALTSECRRLLQALRREDLAIPDADFLDLAPIEWNLEPGRMYWREQLCGISLTDQLWIAVDLDDTLLLGSYTLGKDWGVVGHSFRGMRESMLKTDWFATAKHVIRGTPCRVPCRSAHPFLNNPRVEVAFRPLMVEGLLEFAAAGLGLVFVTASARQRVDYLRMRFPVLDELFSGELGRVITAEEMVEATLEAATRPDLVDDPLSAKAHSLRPRSLAAKTPWAVSRAVGIPPYALLIDDSATTARLFSESGLNDRLLFIEGHHPWSGYGIHILQTAVKKILDPESRSAADSPLFCPEAFRSPPPGVPIPPKVEDPLYFPLLHYRDQF
jgi:hypothetical protein